TMTLIGVTSYLPVYIQAVQGRPAILAGIPLSAMLFAWPLASAVSGRILRHLSMRVTLRFGAILMPVGALFLLLMRPDSSPAFAGVGPFIMGFGMASKPGCRLTPDLLGHAGIRRSLGCARHHGAGARVGNAFGRTAVGAFAATRRGSSAGRMISVKENGPAERGRFPIRPMTQ